MKAYLKYISVIDKENRNHFVKFSTGVNIITGKSSTGKSAMIEIFDYCFGSSEFTVPEGVITDNADIYFIVIEINKLKLILARKQNERKAFLKEESEISDKEIENIDNSYFKDNYFMSLDDFKSILGRHFGIDIIDTDEDLEDRKLRKYNAKKPKPSIRNFMSFILQHQDLIANKHSVFYRFDEKEKREQTIEQFKIFAGFVKQEYFIKKQKLAELERELKKNQYLLQRQEEEKQRKNIMLDGLLKEFIAITGIKLLEENAEQIFKMPAVFVKRKVYQFSIEKYTIILKKINGFLAIPQFL